MGLRNHHNTLQISYKVGEKVHPGRFKVMVALLIAGSAISLMFPSCGGKKKAPPMNDENLITRTVDSMEWLTTKNGKTTNLFKASLMEDHAFAKPAFQEYRRGIEVIGYDSLEQEASHILADYALHWTERDLWDLKGNVIVVGEDGRRLTTQQLMWDIKLKKIYSNVDSKVEEGEDVFIGEGFEAADDFSQWTFRRLKGRVSVDVEPAADSTTVSAEGAPGDTSASPPSISPAATQPSTQPTPPSANQAPKVDKPAAQPPVPISTTSVRASEPHAIKLNQPAIETLKPALETVETAEETSQSASETADELAAEKTPQP